MTAEIAILNKEGVALAADSAVTVSVDGGVKIFPSANKIFTLSKYYPVGSMIYSASEMLGIPWETAIKTYRSEIADKSYPHLEDYTASLVNFLESHTGLYPTAQMDEFGEVELRSLFRSILNTFFEEYRKVLTGQRNIPDNNPEVLLDEIIEANHETAKTMPLFETHDGVVWDKDTIRDVEKEFAGSIRSVRDEVFSGIELSSKQKKLLTMTGKLSLTRAVGATGFTGLVVAGYGENDYCPKVNSIEVYGNLGGRLRFIHKRSKNAAIGVKSNAAIIPFAQSEMVTTFMEGVDPSYQATINQAIFTGIRVTAEAIFGQVATNGSAEANNKVISEIIGKVSEELVNTLSTERWKHFTGPVLSIVGALPKVELASMAESLVNLTSMKRHVSSVSETVGGPIDVALVSKGDGFVWIKRKHYFDKDLNFHFFDNYYRGGTRNESC